MQEFIFDITGYEPSHCSIFYGLCLCQLPIVAGPRPPIIFIILKAAALWASSYSKSIGKGAIYRLASSDNESSASNPLFFTMLA